MKEKIKQLMIELNLWKESYNIEFNSNPSGQSLTFFIEENGIKIYIAKFFNYMQGLKEEIIDCLEIDADTIEDFENQLSDNATSLDVEEILECIYVSKKSFSRYIEVCQKSENLFPYLYGFKENIKIKNKFYGLLIEKFINGTSLNTIIANMDREVIDIYEYAIDFLVKVSEILKKYNEYGFVHRDISPDNIIIEENSITIIDPGFIKITDRNSTKLGYLLGKVYYASPEQYSGYAVDVNFSSDIYSVGIILYEIITGKNLIKEYLQKDRNCNPHDEILKNLDRSIEDEYFKYTKQESDKEVILFNIIKKMLQKDKKLRFYDINAFIDAVSLLKGGE